MKPFKKHLIEATGDGRRRDYNPAAEAHYNISDILEDLYSKETIPNPEKKGETLDVLGGPTINIYADKYGSSVRRYRWPTWGQAFSALSTSMVGHDHALGRLTGNYQGQNLSSEQIHSLGKDIGSKFSPIITHFKNDHLALLYNLKVFHPEMKKNLDVLFKLGHTLEQINHEQFHNSLQKRYLHNSDKLKKSFGGQSGEAHDNLQTSLAKENNRAVTIHNHPHGFMLSGGIPSLTAMKTTKPIIEEPHPSKPDEWVDISHRYEI